MEGHSAARGPRPVVRGDPMSEGPRGRRSPLVWFRNRGVRVQILSSVLVASLVGVAVGVLGIVALGRTNDATEEMYEDNFLALVDAAALRRATTELRLAVANQAASLNDATREKYEAMVDTSEAEIATLVESYAAHDLGPIRREALAQYRAGLDAYLTVVDDELLPAGRAGNMEEWAYVRDTEATPIIDDMMAALMTMVDREKTDAEETVAAAESAFTANRLQVIGLLTVGTALAVALALLVAKSLMGCITRVQRVCEALQRKDLTVTADIVYTDEIGRMGGALDAAVGSLRELITTIDGSSGSLASAAEQVSRNIQTVAAGAEQMGASIQEIASNATSAAQVARTAVGAAEETGETMSRLGESSREIGNVVKLITSIAEQTNLLALNATIEAARAGEAGKGFAVVAGEVKELAQETAKATEDIARRVDAIQADTDGAVSAMAHITEIIGSINDYQMTIASAVEEQTATTSDIGRNVGEAATGSGEIAANIAGVAQAADLTTSGVEQSRRAVTALAEMSSDLKTLVGAFRV